MAEKVICAYLSDWDWKGIPPEAAACLTHVNYAFGTLRNGRVTDEGWQHAAELKEAMRVYPGLRFCLSVGGWGAGGFSEAAASEKGREQFAASAAELVAAYGFRGIDVDWEYPCRSVAGIGSSPRDRENFTKLLRCLRQQLDRKSERTGIRYPLSIAVATLPTFAADLELPELGSLLDTVNLMTYDMAEPDRVTHHTNLYPSEQYPGGWSVEEAVRHYHQAGIPLEKLVIGGAFYGHVYEANARQPLGCREAVHKEPISYAAIRQECTSERGYQRFWDQSARAPYWSNGKRVVVGDDAQSLKEKVNYVYAQGLGGIMFWEYNSDAGGELTCALGAAVQAAERS